MIGFWPLIVRKGEAPLYTGKAADIIIDTVTKREYKRGRIELFDPGKEPSLIESIEGRYKFVYLGGKNKRFGSYRDDVLTGIFINSFSKDRR